MNLLSGSTANKLQQKQLHKQQEELEKRRKKGARLHGEAGAAVCIQRWFRNKQKKKQQQRDDGTICGRIRRWWGDVNTGADNFYHKHVSHDAKPTLADLAKRKTKTATAEDPSVEKKLEDSKTPKEKANEMEISSDAERLVKPNLCEDAEKIKEGDEQAKELV